MEFELNKKDEQFLRYMGRLEMEELLGVFRILNVKLGEDKTSEELVCEAIEIFHGLPRKPRRQLLKVLKEATS